MIATLYHNIIVFVLPHKEAAILSQKALGLRQLVNQPKPAVIQKTNLAFYIAIF